MPLPKGADQCPKRNPSLPLSVAFLRRRIVYRRHKIDAVLARLACLEPDPSLWRGAGHRGGPLASALRCLHVQQARLREDWQLYRGMRGGHGEGQ